MFNIKDHEILLDKIRDNIKDYNYQKTIHFKHGGDENQPYPFIQFENH